MVANINQIGKFVLWLDPIEQYEIPNLFFFAKIYNPVALLLMVISLVIVLFYRSFRLNIFGFLLEKSFLLIKDTYISVHGLKNQKYVFFYHYMFLWLFAGNLIGLLPGAFTITAQLAIPIFFSFTALGGTIFIGIEQRGLQFFSSFSPTGVPKLLQHFLIVVEFISFCMRFFSLPVRLIANMIAGHALLKILYTFVGILAGSAGVIGLLGSFGLMLFLIIILTLEILIAFLQAYVFVFLAIIYLKEVL